MSLPAWPWKVKGTLSVTGQGGGTPVKCRKRAEGDEHVMKEGFGTWGWYTESSIFGGEGAGGEWSWCFSKWSPHLPCGGWAESCSHGCWLSCHLCKCYVSVTSCSDTPMSSGSVCRHSGRREEYTARVQAPHTCCFKVVVSLEHLPLTWKRLRISYLLLLLCNCSIHIQGCLFSNIHRPSSYLQDS